MSRFYKIDKIRLTNGQHFSFVSAFLTLMEEFNFTENKVAKAFMNLKRSFAEEDKYFKIPQNSNYTEQLKEADSKRDHYYGWLKRIVTVWSETAFDSESAAAKKIKKIIDLYKIDTSKQYDEQSGLIDNFLTDISESELKDACKAVGVNKFVSELRTTNNEVKSLLKQRAKELAGKQTGKLRAARLESDTNYDKLVDVIEAFSITAEDTSRYEEFIDEWNVTIERYKDMLNRKSSKNSPEEEDNEENVENNNIENETNQDI